MCQKPWATEAMGHRSHGKPWEAMSYKAAHAVQRGTELFDHLTGDGE
jgi:hypothetical protein